MQRVPLCPDCKEPGKPVKNKNRFFRCPNCGSVWQEVDWELRLAREQANFEEMEKRRGINSLIVIGELACDNCGKAMFHGEKYCYNTKELIEDICGSEPYQRGKRYCEKCSIDAGYLRFNGEEYTMTELKGPVCVKPPVYSFDGVCKLCGQPLIRLYHRNNNKPVLACDNVNCRAYRNPL